MAQVVWSERARDQLRVIVSYLAERVPLSATEWADRLISAPDILEHLPEIGSPVEDAGVPDLRELLVGPYRIVYTIRGDECHILIVFHAHRDIANVLFDDLWNPDD